MSTYSKDDRTNANAISTSNTPDNIQQSKKTSQLQTRRLRPRVHHPNRMVEYDRHHTDGTHASQTKGMGEGLREKRMAQPQENRKSLESGTVHRPYRRRLSKPEKHFPARAAETIKPIIDGGSDARLWDDDDSQHRHSTVYIQLPTPAPVNHYRLSVLIIPVPESMPKYQITSRLASNIDQHWRNNPNPPAWHDGYSVSFTIPDKQWITSNYTDSDLIARQNGERKSATWGRGGSFGIRERVRAQLIELAFQQWKRQAYRPYERFAIIAGIAYPYGVKTADPDNAAETVNTILHSGTRIGAWPDVNSQHCRGVAFVRLPNLMTGNHMVRLFVFPVPENFQMAQSIAESSIDAWGEHDRRMR